MGGGGVVTCVPSVKLL